MTYLPPTPGSFVRHVADMRRAAKNAPAAATPPPLKRRSDPSGPSEWTGIGYDAATEAAIDAGGRDYQQWRRTFAVPDHARRNAARDRPDCPVHDVRWTGDGLCWAQGAGGQHC